MTEIEVALAIWISRKVMKIDPFLLFALPSGFYLRKNNTFKDSKILFLVNCTLLLRMYKKWSYLCVFWNINGSDSQALKNFKVDWNQQNEDVTISGPHFKRVREWKGKANSAAGVWITFLVLSQNVIVSCYTNWWHHIIF